MTEDRYAHVDLKITEDISSFVKRALSIKDLPAQLKTKLEQITPHSKTIKFSLLLEVHTNLAAQNVPNLPPLWKLTLQSSEIILPEPYISPRSIVVQQRVDTLKQKFANIEYGRMTSNLTPSSISPRYRSTGYEEVRCVKRQVTMVINFVLVVIGSFAFGYFLSDMFGQSHATTLQRISCGFTLALIVFFADLYFLLKNMDKCDGTQNLLNAKRT
ncbi:hypothetical protein Aperf_G00000089340 [Anoplocephala perfoliata]